METISVQLSAALYTSIYVRYGEETSATINACLARLLDVEESPQTDVEAATLQYPRPGAGTKTGRVWEIADRIRIETGTVDREVVVRACMLEGININTASTQFSHWRKANP
jgi:hypothetical protein